MSAELDTTLRSLHACYCEWSGHSTPYVTCERRWWEFEKAGFDKEDLRLVIEHVKRINSKRDAGFRLSLRFDKVVGDLERMGDLLGEARADKRARDFRAKHAFVQDKASVLRATGRADSQEIPEACLSAKEALAKLKASL